MEQPSQAGHILRRKALPAIDIAARDPWSTIDAIACLAEADTSLIVERYDAPFGYKDWCIVNFRSIRPSPHEEGGGQLIARPDRPGRAVVEMRAKRWSPNPPTREIYVTAARELFGPLLRAYNRAHACTSRLRIARSRKLGSRLSPKTRALIDRFAILANRASLHPRDWDRFYRIVKESRREAPMEDVRAMLIEHGFTSKRGDELAELYEHLWAYKNMS